MKNKWSIRLTRDFFTWYEIIRCLKHPVYKAPKGHKFCWGRILFWYIDFRENK